MTKTELEACIQAYGTDIYSFCRHLTRCLQEAEDLYQDTFLKAIEKSGSTDYEKNPKSYLLSIALRIWKNKRRKAAWRKRIADIQAIDGQMPEAPFDLGGQALEHEVLKKEEALLVRQAVNRLPERLKIPTLLHYMEDLPLAEIAAVMKIPVGTVKSRLHQARKALEKELEVVLDEKH